MKPKEFVGIEDGVEGGLAHLEIALAHEASLLVATGGRMILRCNYRVNG